jgi:hypothetical protein
MKQVDSCARSREKESAHAASDAAPGGNILRGGPVRQHGGGGPGRALSQSATSAALQQLERALGVQLFERVGALVLNDAGRALLPQALGVLEQARA